MPNEPLENEVTPTPEKKQRKARTPDDDVVQVLTPDGQWGDIKHGLASTDEAKRFIRVAIPVEFEQFVGKELRIVAVKWTGKVDVEKVVKGTLTD